MTTMTTSADEADLLMRPTRIELPVGRPLTVADLDAIEVSPGDGRRYELIDGVLIVSPAPITRHQRAVARLYLLLEAACPDELEVLFAPYDVELDELTRMQPDLLVAPIDDYTERNLQVAPLLAVEVLSPSTRGVDLLLKKDRLRRAGCAHYWVVDPVEPSITAWRLAGDVPEYVSAGHGSGADAVRLTEPFRVTVVPSRLVGPRSRRR